MKTIGNIIWVLFGGLFLALGYFASSILLFITIIGIPFGMQTMKLGVLALWPFGHEVSNSSSSNGCLSLFMNIFWIIFGGLEICIGHIILGIIFCITIIGIPFGKQHFKLATIALTPFGRQIK